jgi:hypothetical protein
MRRTLAPALAVLFLCQFPVLSYVGAYYATVERGCGIVMHSVCTWHPAYQVDKIGGVDAESFFAPAHYVDRRLRPRYWETRPRLLVMAPEPAKRSLVGQPCIRPQSIPQRLPWASGSARPA